MRSFALANVTGSMTLRVAGGGPRGPLQLVCSVPAEQQSSGLDVTFRRVHVAYGTIQPEATGATVSFVNHGQGFEAAREAGVKEVAVFAAASESFSRRNINCSIAESLERFELVVAGAKEAGIAVRGYVSCVVDCPYEVCHDLPSVFWDVVLR